MCFDPRPHFRHFARSERGAVAVMVALALTVLMGMLALSVDLGSLYFRQKALQTRADLAAVAAVSTIEDASGAAARTVTANQMAPAQIAAVDFGQYRRDPALHRDDRLTPVLAAAAANAVTVSLTDRVPLTFGRVLTDREAVDLGARATAARFDAAAFSLGSRLLSLNEGLLNALLGAALGTTVNLSVADYNALADTQIDLLTFTEALATRADLTALDFADILGSDVGLPAVLGAVLDSSAGSPAVGVLQPLVNAAAQTTLGARQLIALQGSDAEVVLEDVLPRITVSALDMVMASVDAVNAQRQIDVGLNLSVPGVTTTEVAVLLGEREVQSGWVTVGTDGAFRRTAQTRLKVDLGLNPTLLGGLGTGVSVLSLHLPIYLEVAGAGSELTELDCTAQNPGDVIARFDTGFDPLETTGAGPHVARLFIGEFGAEFTDTTQPLDAADLGYADFLDIELNLLLIRLPLLTVQIRSHAVVGTGLEESVAFTLGDVGQASPATIGSGDLLGSAVSSLLAGTDVRLSSQSSGLIGAVLGLVAGTLNGLLAILPERILANLLTPVDGVLDALLAGLGIGVGEVDLTLHDVRCGKIQLVR